MSAGEVRVELVADTTKYVAALHAAAEAAQEAHRRLENFKRRARATALFLELLPLTPDQAWARFYVRGAMDPAYATPAAVDAYIRALSLVPGPVAETARTAFLHGWAEHRSVEHARSVVWHRYIGDTAIQINPEADR
jgi:hypothetical protein